VEPPVLPAVQVIGARRPAPGGSLERLYRIGPALSSGAARAAPLVA